MSLFTLQKYHSEDVTSLVTKREMLEKRFNLACFNAIERLKFHYHYMIGICKCYQLSISRVRFILLSDSLVMSVLTYGVDMWGELIMINTLAKNDILVGRARKYSYTSKSCYIKEIIHQRSINYWRRLSKISVAISLLI